LKKIILGISEKNQSEYWEIVNAGFLECAKRLNLEFIIKAPPSENIECQLADIEKFVEQEVDGIAFVATNTEPFTPVVAKALKKGIPVLCFDLDAPKSGRYAFIGMPQPIEMGKMAGKYMLEKIPPGGTVAIQTGSMTAMGAMGKLSGFQEMADENNLKIVAIKNDYEQTNLALENTKALLAEYPDLDGLYGIYGYHAWCQAQAVKELKLKRRPKIIGFDMFPQTVTYIDEGLIDYAIWIGEYYFGYYTAVFLSNMARIGVTETLFMSGLNPDNYLSNIINLPVVAFSKANIDEFKIWSEKHNPFCLIAKKQE
jgi:ribose transport system substrate-binding protein